jgi:uncharacterized hydrophobic protein (TIGR00271 family)
MADVRAAWSSLRFQDRLATLLGCEPAARPAIVQAMIHRSPRESTAYWLQLVVATGIATLGLVLGSTAVVIAAMLVAPLMGPIVGLGMGLAVGSPFLVLRSSGRVIGSVALVVAMSAALTGLLPFHAINDEIAARTTPTALDLGTAVFCAMAGVYASMRPSSDVATTAAGTSIGISLVPPLCVSGYGLGTTSVPVASGAALLFLTNFVAIVLVGTVAFAAAGFGRVDFAAIETEELKDQRESRVARALASRLASLVPSKGGPWLRLLMPVLLLAALYQPLRTGLDEVAWQIRARAQVTIAIAALPRRVVESRVRVERHTIALVIFLLGTRDDAASARAQLEAELARTTGVSPQIEIHAVPDATAFEALERALEKPAVPVPAPSPEVPPIPPAEQVAQAQRLVVAAVSRRWPEASAGPPLLSESSIAGDTLHLRVAHRGAALDAAALETLERVLTEDLGGAVHLEVETVPSEPLVATDPAVLARLARLLPIVARIPTLVTCVTEPPAPKAAPRTRPQMQEAALRDAIEVLLAAQPRLTRVPGAPHTLTVVEGRCPEPQP